jgi:hypothetical protein
MMKFWQFQVLFHNLIARSEICGATGRLRGRRGSAHGETMKTRSIALLILLSASGLTALAPNAAAFCEASQTLDSGVVSTSHTWARAYLTFRSCDTGNPYQSVSYDHASGAQPSWYSWRAVNLGSGCSSCSSAPWSETDTYIGSCYDCTNQNPGWLDAQAWVHA